MNRRNLLNMSNFQRNNAGSHRTGPLVSLPLQHLSLEKSSSDHSVTQTVCRLREANDSPKS